MTKIFLKTLSLFYYEKMVASAPHEVSEMVAMGIRLEEAVREGRLKDDVGTTNGPRKFNNGFLKKKEGETHALYHQQQFRSRRNVTHPYQRQVAAVTPVLDAQPQYQQNQSRFQQGYVNRNQQGSKPPNQNQQSRGPTRGYFDPIPMTYTELYPALIQRKLIQNRAQPPGYYHGDTRLTLIVHFILMRRGMI